jgi:polar amino acid transport system substrate-binding protein
MRKLILLLALLYSIVVPGHAADPKPLVIGMELGYPPFETVDKEGKPTGVSVGMAKALGESLGRPIEIKDMAFDGLIPALKTGKIDLIISSMTATEERAKTIDFTDSYVTTGLCLLVKKDSKIQKIDDLKADPKAIVVVARGTTGNVWATKNLKPNQIRVQDTEQNSVIEVVQGKADAFIYDQMSVYKNWQRHPDSTRGILVPFETEHWAIGVKKGDDELKGQVNAFLKKYREEGGFEKLGDEYLADQKKAFKELGYPFFF